MAKSEVSKAGASAAAAAAPGGSGGPHFVDPRIEALMILVDKRPDNLDIIESRFAEVRAQNAKLIDERQTVEINTRNRDARYAFAEFASDNLSRKEALNDQSFEFLLNEFQALDPAYQERAYKELSPAGQEKYIAAIRSAKDEFLTAFGAITEESELVMPSTPRDTSLSFSAMPETIEQVDACFDSFYKDPRFADYLAGRSDVELLNLFKFARAAAGVIETPQSAAAISQFAEWFNLRA